MGAASFINSVNTDYEALHKSFEEQFWGTKMALSDERFSVPELTRTKGEMEAFLADEQKLKTTREHLAKASELSEAEQKTLALFERTFQCYIMESAEAKELRATATRIEGALEAARNKMRLGAPIPDPNPNPNPNPSPSPSPGPNRNPYPNPNPNPISNPNCNPSPNQARPSTAALSSSRRSGCAPGCASTRARRCAGHAGTA